MSLTRNSIQVTTKCGSDSRQMTLYRGPEGTSCNGYNLVPSKVAVGKQMHLCFTDAPCAPCKELLKMHEQHLQPVHGPFKIYILVLNINDYSRYEREEN